MSDKNRKRRGPRRIEPDEPPDLDTLFAPHRDKMLGWATQGLTSKQIADRLGGVALPSQVYRWLSDSEQRLILESARHEQLQAANRSLTMALPLAIATGVRVLNSETATDRDRIAAARLLLGTYGHERIAGALDAVATVMDESARETLKGKVETLVERAAKAQADGPPQLRAVEGGGDDDGAGA